MAEKTWGQIRKRDSLAKEYSSKDVAESYLDIRFKSAIGRVLHEHQVSFLNQLIREYNIKRILEIACGPARLTAEIEGSFSGIAVDFNESMLEVASNRINSLGRKHRWDLKQGDAFSLSLDEKFDLIYSFRFIRHFTLKDRVRLYDVAKKHLVDGGLLVFDVVNKAVSYPARLRHGLENYKIYDKLYDKKEFIQEMEDNGFTVISMEPVQVLYELQYFIQIYIAPRSYDVAYNLIKFLEKSFKYLGIRPMEWIAVCRLK